MKPWKIVGITAIILAIIFLFVANLFVVYTSDREGKGYTTIGVPGSPGQVGQQGPAGTDGVAGLPGRDGQVGVSGADGKDGTDGAIGQPGQNGTNGINGTNGQDGRTPQLGCSGSTIYWRYTGDANWIPLGKVLTCSSIQSFGE